MKNWMRKFAIIFEAVIVSLLIVSTATAVPQVQSASVTGVVRDVNQNKVLLEEQLTSFKNKLDLLEEKVIGKSLGVKTTGIILALIMIIWRIINKIIIAVISILASLIIPPCLM